MALANGQLFLGYIENSFNIALNNTHNGSNKYNMYYSNQEGKLYK
jgi:hypothetical protein